MNPQPFLEASPAIQIHMLAAIAAFFLGAVILWRRKGGSRHRQAGQVWVVLMAVTALSGLLIHEIRLWGQWSPIHLLSVLVPISLYQAVRAARARQISRHRKIMQSTYAGGMLIAGGFTFFPGRLMHEIFIEPVRMGGLSHGYDWLLLLIPALVAAWLLTRTARSL